MRSGKLYFLHTIILTVVIGSLIATGCRKENGIDNNKVVRTPYGLYFSDRLGAMYNTNDGKTFRVVFPTDGYNARAIATSGNNILWIKNNLHVSADNGLNFNPGRLSTSGLVTPSPQAKWQNMILDVPSQGRVYMATANSTNGVAWSENNGITWDDDAAPAWEGGLSGLSIQSFSQLKNGELYAMDNSGPRLFMRKQKTDPWKEVVMVTPPPAGKCYLSHFNNALIAVDVTGAGGIFYSDDFGLNWTNYAGVPSNQELFSVAAPLDQVLLAGTDSAGIYRLVGDTFQASNNGLMPFTKVYGIVGKQDIYKNEVIKQFVYIATSNGVFRSEDLGQNWTLVRPGDIRVIY